MAGQERTERPTYYRRRRFRERGMVAYSRDLSAAASFFMAYLALRVGGPWIARALARDLGEFLVLCRQPELSRAGLWKLAGLAAGMFAKAAAAPLAAAAIGALAAGFLQTGFLFSLYPLLPSAERINPLQGLRRLFSLQGLFQAAKGVAVLAVLGVIAWATVRPHILAMERFARMDLVEATRAALVVASALCARCGIAMLAIGAADYAFQWWQMERRMWMTREELREEYRETEGEPLIQMRRRQRRRELLEQRITPELRQASVVVTNPVHLAVALRYELHVMPAPKVVAKGRHAVAQRIVQIARAYRIPVVQNPPVAQAVYKMAPVGAYIPPALYRAVAEILAAVWRQRAEVREQRARAARGGDQAAS